MNYKALSVGRWRHYGENSVMPVKYGVFDELPLMKWKNKVNVSHLHHENECIQCYHHHYIVLKRCRYNQSPNSILPRSLIFRHVAAQWMGVDSKVHTAFLCQKADVNVDVK